MTYDYNPIDIYLVINRNLLMRIPGRESLNEPGRQFVRDMIRSLPGVRQCVFADESDVCWFIQVLPAKPWIELDELTRRSFRWFAAKSALIQANSRICSDAVLSDPEHFVLANYELRKAQTEMDSADLAMTFM